MDDPSQILLEMPFCAFPSKLQLLGYPQGQGGQSFAGGGQGRQSEAVNPGFRDFGGHVRDDWPPPKLVTINKKNNSCFSQVLY